MWHEDGQGIHICHLVLSVIAKTAILEHARLPVTHALMRNCMHPGQVPHKPQGPQLIVSPLGNPCLKSITLSIGCMVIGNVQVGTNDGTTKTFHAFGNHIVVTCCCAAAAAAAAAAASAFVAAADVAGCCCCCCCCYECATAASRHDAQIVAAIAASEMVAAAGDCWKGCF